MAAPRAHAPRRTYLDVLRGVAVLVMIEAHVIDSWTRAADRATHAFGYSLILGGFGAPLFLFLAGVAIPMSAGSKARRLGDAAAAARAVERRGLEVFLLAFAFRVQALILGWAPWHTVLRVDILNIMGPSIVAAAWLWGRFGSTRARVVAFAAATIAIAGVTPAVRAWSQLAVLPDFLEAYIRPTAGLTNFAIFPWTAFVPAGALLGVLLDDARGAEPERRLNVAFLAGGLVVALTAYACSYLPPLFGASYFWTSSPAFFFLRTGILTAAVGLVYWGEVALPLIWPPLALLGRHSLFIYWIHVEMVYGLVSNPLHQGLALGSAWLALGAFCVFMYVCAVLKDRMSPHVPSKGQRQPASLQISNNFS